MLWLLSSFSNVHPFSLVGIKMRGHTRITLSVMNNLCYQLNSCGDMHFKEVVFYRSLEKMHLLGASPLRNGHSRAKLCLCLFTQTHTSCFGV